MQPHDARIHPCTHAILVHACMQADIVAKLAGMTDAKARCMEGVVDVRDESDRTAGVRVVIEVRGKACCVLFLLCGTARACEGLCLRSG